MLPRAGLEGGHRLLRGVGRGAFPEVGRRVGVLPEGGRMEALGEEGCRRVGLLVDLSRGVPWADRLPEGHGGDLLRGDPAAAVNFQADPWAGLYQEDHAVAVNFQADPWAGLHREGRWEAGLVVGATLRGLRRGVLEGAGIPQVGPVAVHEVLHREGLRRGHRGVLGVAALEGGQELLLRRGGHPPRPGLLRLFRVGREGEGLGAVLLQVGAPGGGLMGGRLQELRVDLHREVTNVKCAVSCQHSRG